MASLTARETSQRRRHPYVGHSLTGAVDGQRWWWRSPGYGGCLVNEWREILIMMMKCLRAFVSTSHLQWFLGIKFDNLLLLWQKNIFVILYCTKNQTSLVRYGVRLVQFLLGFHIESMHWLPSLHRSKVGPILSLVFDWMVRSVQQGCTWIWYLSWSKEFADYGGNSLPQSCACNFLRMVFLYLKSSPGLTGLAPRKYGTVTTVKYKQWNNRSARINWLYSYARGEIYHIGGLKAKRCDVISRCLNVHHV